MNTSFLLGIPGKLKTLVDRLTSDRAGYLDNLPTINTNAARLTPARAGYIDYLPTINSRVTAAVATASALATVDSNVDKIYPFASQDFLRTSDVYVSSTSGTTVLSVYNNGGTLAGIVINAASNSYFPSTFIKITIDGGTERTMSGFQYQPYSDTYDHGNYSYGIVIPGPVNFSSSAVVKVGNSDSHTLDACVFYALNN